MGDDEDPIDVQQVHTEDAADQRVRSDPAAGGAEDLRLPHVQPEHLQRLQARVHAGHDGDAGVGDAVEVARRLRGVAAIRSEQVVEVFGHTTVLP